MNLSEIKAVFGVEESQDYPFGDYLNPNAVKALENALKTKAEQTELFVGIITWTEWETGVCGKRIPVEHKERGRIDWTPGKTFANVILESGEFFRKSMICKIF